LTSGGGIEVGLSPRHSNVEGLNPDTSSTKNGKENAEKRMCHENKVTSDGGIVVGHSPHHSNVEGLNPDTSSTKNGKENVEKNNVP
jgi:hypothetical protein